MLFLESYVPIIESRGPIEGRSMIPTLLPYPPNLNLLFKSNIDPLVILLGS